MFALWYFRSSITIRRLCCPLSGQQGGGYTGGFAAGLAGTTAQQSDGSGHITGSAVGGSLPAETGAAGISTHFAAAVSMVHVCHRVLRNTVEFVSFP